MPFFDEHGRRYRERLEAARTEVRLVSESESVIAAAGALLLHARRVAAARAKHAAESMPSALFDDLWKAEREFVTTARLDLGLQRVALPSAAEVLAKQSSAT